ncbi:MAG: hypothetical protein J0L53_16770 [Spirochaetes bacterium]|nr:hypothetical protein [Spirochaetota bacterium]
MKSKLYLILLCGVLLSACAKNSGSSDGSGSGDSGSSSSTSGSAAATETVVELQMPLNYNGGAFNLGSSYTNAAGNTITLSEVRFWVSNVKFVKTDNSEVAVPDSYYLISKNNAVTGDTTGERVPNFDLAAGSRENITLQKVPVGSYKAIKFNVGVDSTYNNNLSLRAGELHLFAHMANIEWSWTTSYIFGKAAGTCTSCSGTTAFSLEYGTNANLQTVTLNFGSNIEVNATSKPTVVANVDVKKLFTGIDIGTVSVDTGVSKRAINGFNNAGQMSTVGANFASAISLGSATSNVATEPDVGSITLNVAKDFNGTAFALNTNFVDDHSNTLKFTRFRYWISNVKLTKADTTQYSVPGSYYLMSTNSVINPSNINSGMSIAAANREQITIANVPAATYTAIQFSVGVDSAYNDDLSKQAGDLHIHQDMANYTWMWNSSYLFSQITGSCESCSTNKNFAFDIGANTNYRTLTAMTLPTNIALTKGKTGVINVRANVAKIFQVNGGAGVNTSTVAASGGVRKINASASAASMANLANAYQNNVFSVTSASVP